MIAANDIPVTQKIREHAERLSVLEGDLPNGTLPTPYGSLISIKMVMRFCPTRLSPASFLSFLVCVLLQSSLLGGEPITVRYTEGSTHGYLAMRTLDGKLVASGDSVQTLHGGQLVSRLIYRFKDGSIDDDTAVFTQHGHFRLISDHRIQRGPMFPRSTDVMIKATTGEVIVRYEDKGQNKVEISHIDIPPDLSNGIVLDIVRNLSFDTKATKMSYLATTPKPRVIHLSVQPEGEDTFVSAGRQNKALRFKIHVEIGGVAGVIAPMVGKEPPDTHVWISAGQVPAFLRSEEPLYYGGPVLRTELVSPVWPQTPKSEREGQGK